MIEDTIPVIVKRAAQYLSCKVRYDWSIIKLRKRNLYLSDRYLVAALFETTSQSLLLLIRKKDLEVWYLFQ